MSTLASRLTYAMQEAGLNTNSLALKIGITRPAMAKIVNGETLEPKKILEISKALGVDVQWLKTGEGEMSQAVGIAERFANEDEEETYRIEQFNVVASCGAGALTDIVEVVSAIEYSENTYRQMFQNMNPDHIKLITSKGDSMQPTIESGELLFVNIKINRYQGDGIYVFSFGETLHIKRLQMAGDKLLVISDNKAYQMWEINEGNQDRFHIHGRVLIGQSMQLKRFG
ncbi:hypothetical protein A1D22_09400 [Pasteurellaceae bacterium LFhippo2]|nr:hypothetical protein [Pasteurellaceae bacterium LFhippo2]